MGTLMSNLLLVPRTFEFRNCASDTMSYSRRKFIHLHPLLNKCEARKAALLASAFRYPPCLPYPNSPLRHSRHLLPKRQLGRRGGCPAAPGQGLAPRKRFGSLGRLTCSTQSAHGLNVREVLLSSCHPLCAHVCTHNSHNSVDTLMNIVVVGSCSCR